MGSAAVDYDALAGQHGGSSGVDYDSLAAQHGGVSDSSGGGVSHWLDSIERFGQGVYDKTLKGAVDLVGAAGHAIANPEQTASAIANSQLVQHPVDTTVKAFKDSYATHADMLRQARVSLSKGDIDDAIERGTNALIPILGPSLQASKDKASGGDVAGGLGEMTGTLLSTLAATPGVTEAVAGKLGDLADAIGLPDAKSKVAETLYQSALKPSQVNPEKAARAVQTGLQAGIPITESGQAKLTGLIDDLAAKTKDTIAKNPNAKIDPAAVAQRLGQAKAKFSNQALPETDLGVIENARQQWLGQHANPTVPPQMLTAEEAQQLKQGTYQQLKSKSYDELKTAQTESEKALARGLKEELEQQFPELQSLNAQQSKLYGLQPYLDKAIARIGNHNVISLGDMVTAGSAGAAGAMHGGPVEGAAIAAGAALMRHVLGSPGFKSRLAIAMTKGAGGAGLKFGAAAGRVNSYIQALDDALSSGAATTATPAATLPMAASGNQEQQ